MVQFIAGLKITMPPSFVILVVSAYARGRLSRVMANTGYAGSWRFCHSTNYYINYICQTFLGNKVEKPPDLISSVTIIGKNGV